MGYELYQRDGGDIWHAYFIDREGKRQRFSTKQADKRKANVVADEWYRRLADPTYSAANSTTIDDASKKLIVALKRMKRSKATTEHFYPTKLSQIARVMDKDLPLARIDAKRVDGYISEREAEGASAHTISKELTALRQLLKHARRRGEFDKELSQVMPIGFASGYVPRTRRLTIPEARRLIEEVPGDVRRYVAFVCATTARDAAVGRARGRHLTSAGIEVYDRKTKASTRLVPLNAMTEPFALYAFEGIGPDDPVCPGIGSVRHAFDRATKRLGIAHVSPNDLRRSVAHWLLERGVPRDAAAAFMGHANTKMLDAVYGKLDAKELSATISRSLLLTAPAAEPQVATATAPEEFEGEVVESPQEPAGSRVEETWKTESDRRHGVDEVDIYGSAELTEIAANYAIPWCAETESNRRHGDFQSFRKSEERSQKRVDHVARVEGSWKSSDSPSDRGFRALSWLSLTSPRRSRAPDVPMAVEDERALLSLSRAAVALDVGERS